MLAKIHHVCRGHIPLSINLSLRNLLDNALLDGNAVAYVRTVQADIAHKGDLPVLSCWTKLTHATAQFLRSLPANHRHKTDLYFCHQMFFDSWEPGPSHIGELLE